MESAFSRKGAPDSKHAFRGDWNYLTIQLARTSDDEAGDPDLYGVFTGGQSGQVDCCQCNHTANRFCLSMAASMLVLTPAFVSSLYPRLVYHVPVQTAKQPYLWL